MQFPGDLPLRGAGSSGQRHASASACSQSPDLLSESVLPDNDGKEARGSWDVVPDSGTDELHGLSGEGEFRAPLKSTPSVVLHYVVK
jgi:hypothetical protein